MAVQETQTADAKARITLPKGFAKATVILEKISDTELRIRRTDETARAVRKFPEQTGTALSDRDRDRFLELMESPPRANAALRKAMSKHRKGHG